MPEPQSKTIILNRQLIYRIRKFAKTSKGKELDLISDAAFFEVAGLLLLMQFDKEVSEAFKTLKVDARNLRQLAKERKDIIRSVPPIENDPAAEPAG